MATVGFPVRAGRLFVTLKNAIAKAIDAYHKDHPRLTVAQIIKALDSIADRLDAGLRS